MTGSELATRQPQRLRADPSRVVLQLFVPGHYLPGQDGARPSGVVAHVLALPEAEVVATLADTLARFAPRHHDLLGTFRRHAERIGNRLEPGISLSDERWLLLGATFTHEFSVEAAALCNPSMVAHPDQSGVPTGALRFVMSVRQIGEGHRSSIGFRTGVVDAAGAVALDPPSPHTTTGTIGDSLLDAAVFRDLAARVHDDTESTRWVLEALGEHFTAAELDARLSQLEGQRDTRRNVTTTVGHLRALVARTYTARFASEVELGGRVLSPATSIESNGMEDARFVRFVDDDGSVTYHATYTAYDGIGITQQLLATTDFRTFSVSPLVGAGAANKGMALFPRRIQGRFVALSRHDGASNAVATSPDRRQWPTTTPLLAPVEAWEVVQVGNCGPPIETDQGWLVLTHGVGPMRTYAIGAWLLDLDDPTRVIGRLRTPLLRPRAEEQDGYVPNVVYSCGALRHGDVLVVPFGIGDDSIGFATASVPELVETLLAGAEVPAGVDARG